LTEYIDKIAPPEIGEDRIRLSIDSSCLPLLALSPVIIDVDYELAEPEGIELPIELIIQPSSIDGTGYIRRKFIKHAPSSFQFTPIHAGRHLVLLKECCHNLWQGRLLINVGGDEADKIELLDRT
jgi:hypothetical protein